MQLWDTSGCEKYRSITTSHYRKAVGALLVYDITSESSFKSLPYWLDNLREHGDENMIVALIANKCDIIFTDPSKRQVLKDSGHRYARENNLLFMDEMSALADINVGEQIDQLIESINRIQTDLINSGKKKESALKITYEEEERK